MKEASAWLAERLEHERDRFFRLGPAPLAPRPERRLAPQQAESLAAVLRLLGGAAGRAVRCPTWGCGSRRWAQFVERFRAVLRRRRRLDFEQEVAGLSRVEQAVAFLALLELRKGGEVVLEQAAPFAPIRIVRADVEGRESPWIARSA